MNNQTCLNVMLELIGIYENSNSKKIPMKNTVNLYYHPFHYPGDKRYLINRSL